jgi:hypothetical protein
LTWFISPHIWDDFCQAGNVSLLLTVKRKPHSQVFLSGDFTKKRRIKDFGSSCAGCKTPGQGIHILPLGFAPAGFQVQWSIWWPCQVLLVQIFVIDAVQYVVFMRSLSFTFCTRAFPAEVSAMDPFLAIWRLASPSFIRSCRHRAWQTFSQMIDVLTVPSNCCWKEVHQHAKGRHPAPHSWTRGEGNKQTVTSCRLEQMTRWVNRDKRALDTIGLPWGVRVMACNNIKHKHIRLWSRVYTLSKAGCVNNHWKNGEQPCKNYPQPCLSSLSPVIFRGHHRRVESAS